MSLFFNAGQLSQDVSEEKIEIARIQFEAMSQTFSTAKCIPNEYGENELNKGEATCIDRCVKKFVKANLLIGQQAQAMNFQPTNLHQFDKFQ